MTCKKNFSAFCLKTRFVLKSGIFTGIKLVSLDCALKSANYEKSASSQKLTALQVNHRGLAFLFQSELSDQRKITEEYRGKLLALEAEMTDLRDQANANKEVLKSRTRNMVDQVDSLKDRYENLEKRRKNEAEGYQADVNLLKQKLRNVESQLVRAAVAKTKGELDICFLRLLSVQTR